MLQVLKHYIVKAVNSVGYDFVRLHDATGITLINAFALVVKDYMARKPSGSFSFVQIGANDGVRFDPVHDLIADNWRGVLVEPDPEQFAALKKNYAGRSNLQFEMAAITDFNGIATLYRSDGPEFDSIASALDKQSVLGSQRMRPGMKGTKLIPVECNAMTLNTLFSKHDISLLDLLVMDTEGHDYNILRQLLDKTTVRPGIIQYENENMTRQKEQECRALLAKAGYAVLPVGVDTVALRQVPYWQESRAGQPA
jgi:FkbM family methyltransferase